MKKWEILNNFQFSLPAGEAGIFNFQLDRLVRILLENRGIKTEREIDEFLNPRLEGLDIGEIGVSKKDLAKTLKRIKTAIEKKELIIIFGDYDADGITGTAILWESLSSLKANVMPYIPNRIEEGYGLSVPGIKNLKLKYKDCSVIITVDNGIVANKAVKFANSLKIDVIITDHHVPGKSLPNAYSIIHSTKVCGAGVAWFLSKEFARGPATRFPPASARSRLTELRAVGSPSTPVTPHLYNHLDLVTIATIADLVPLVGPNRTLVKFGLDALKKTKRVGLLSLFDEAGIDKDKIGTYEIGYIIAPRLNAMGRLEEGMDSLRLLCTTDAKKAKKLARKLGEINRSRQQITIETVEHAKGEVDKKKLKKLLFVYHESYQQGVIGLVAGRLVEEYYLPSIVLSKGEKFSKASARSVTGLNIIEFIREASEFLVDVGGHPMAAGFTIETSKIPELEKKFEELAKRLISKENLVRKLKIDCELPLGAVDLDLFDSISKLAPFGMKNPTPVFLSKGLIVENLRFVGKDGKHLKFEFKVQNSPVRQAQDKQVKIDGILFNYDKSLDLKIGDKVDVVYSIEINEWGGNKKIELKIKDIKKQNY